MRTRSSFPRPPLRDASNLPDPRLLVMELAVPPSSRERVPNVLSGQHRPEAGYYAVVWNRVIHGQAAEPREGDGKGLLSGCILLALPISNPLSPEPYQIPSNEFLKIR
jgi:hypothetical protein